MNGIVESKVKCKCGSADIDLCEVWEDHTINWEQIDGKFNRDHGALEMGYAHKVEALCKRCKKRWTIRKALQIDDIIKL